MGMITKEDRELINKLYDKFKKGERINSSELTSLYNRVLNKKENNTTCGSCLRQRLFKLVDVLGKATQNYAKNLTNEDIEFLKWSQTLEEGHYPSFDRVVEIYNRAFNQNKPITNCLKCILTMLSDLYELI